MQPLALAPATSWSGVIAAIGGALTAVAVVIAAISAALIARRTSRRQDRYQADTIARLTVIHTLVNSTLTEALKAQLGALNRLLAASQLAAARDLAGTQATPDQQAEVAGIERQISDLTRVMVDRAAQAQVANMQMAAERERKADEAARG